MPSWVMDIQRKHTHGCGAAPASQTKLSLIHTRLTARCCHGDPLPVAKGGEAGSLGRGWWNAAQNYRSSIFRCVSGSRRCCYRRTQSPTWERRIVSFISIAIQSGSLQCKAMPLFCYVLLWEEPRILHTSKIGLLHCIHALFQFFSPFHASLFHVIHSRKIRWGLLEETALFNSSFQAVLFFFLIKSLHIPFLAVLFFILTPYSILHPNKALIHYWKMAVRANFVKAEFLSLR